MSWPFVPSVQPPSATSDNGVHFSAPWQFMSVVGTAARYTVYDEAVQVLSDAATFWTEMGERGVAVDSDYTANTYKTILNITSGRSLTAAIIGPTMVGTDTTTFEITRDGGGAQEIAITGSAGLRAGLIVGALTAAAYTTAGTWGNSYFDFNAGKTLGTMTTALVIPAIEYMTLQGTPLLICNQSLLIRIKNSANVTGTASQERQSGVMYRQGIV
jgi:hypothetical protein